jgi:hypothetical protein
MEISEPFHENLNISFLGNPEVCMPILSGFGILSHNL